MQNSETHSRVEVKDFVPKNYDTEEIFMKTMSQDHLNARAMLCIEKNQTIPDSVIENSASFKNKRAQMCVQSTKLQDITFSVMFKELAVQLFSPLQEDLQDGFGQFLWSLYLSQHKNHKDSDCKWSNNFTM